MLLTRDLFESEIFPKLSNSENLNLCYTCKALYSLHSLVQKRILNRLADIFYPKINLSSVYDYSYSSDLESEVDKIQISNKLTTPIQHSSFNTNLDIISQLSQIGVIAGGSMVHALNEFVENTSVSDLDIYLPSKDSFKEAIHILLHSNDVLSITTLTSMDYDGGTSVPIPDSNQDPDSNTGENDISILTVKMRSLNAIYQLIYFEFESAFDVICSFDLDFVQVGLYQGHVYRTRACIESHIQQKVIRGYHIPRKNRLLKAINKGFSALPIGKTFKAVEDTNCIQLHNTNFDELQLTPFTPRKSIGEFFFDQLEVTRLEKADKVSFHNNFPAGHRDITYTIDMFCSLNGKEFKTHTLPVEIDVIQYTSAFNSIRIAPFPLGSNFVITNCSVKQSFSPGKYVVDVFFRYNSNPNGTGLPRINMKIERILSPSTRPVKLSNNLIINM